MSVCVCVLYGKWVMEKVLLPDILLQLSKDVIQPKQFIVYI